LQEVQEEIKIPKGVFNGIILRLNGKGNDCIGGQTSDVLITVDVNPL
jgi:DnaJ-class molecular chaperone